ncbi:MAG TPA: acyl-CoA dehydrogenase family protein [Dehalococcoidia bacterium]|nr:acyl-CoA dehydrogenase family protein [Dehalococcoidia bacterium]
MTTIDLSEAVTPLLATARAFRPRLLAERDRIETERRLPDDLAADLAAAGFFRISLPAAYGGLDLKPAEGLLIFEELAKADPAVAWCVWNGNTYWTVARLDARAAAEIFSAPAVITANSTQPKGRAEVVDGGYRVSGRWSLVSGCQISEWLQLHCIVHEGGSPRPTPAGTPQRRHMYCRTADCRIVDTWSAGGLRGTGSHDVIVEDLFVPEHCGSWHSDPLVLPEPRYRFPSSTRVGPGCGALALGIARAAIEALIELGGAKRPEVSRGTLSEDHGAQARLAQAEALVGSARLLLFETVERLWSQVLADGEADAAGCMRVRLATNHAVNSAVQAVDLLYLSGGATSLYTSFPLERAFRDVHAMTQHAVVHPRVMEAAGRVLFGLEPDTPIF